MALPGGLATYTLTFGDELDLTGNAAFANMQGKLTLSRPMVDSVTGSVVFQPVTFTLDANGRGSVGPLVCNDEPRVTQGTAYTVTWLALSYKPTPGGGNKTFTVSTTDGATVDYDTIANADGTVTPGVAPQVPLVTSVVGHSGAVTGAQIAADAAVRAALVPSNDLSAFGIYLPEKYGAVGDGTTNDTTAVQAALTAACAVNGSVYLSRNYAIPSGGLTVSARIKIFGSGAFDGNVQASAALLCSSATADALTINADGFVLEDFAVINTAATPSAGAGIKVTRGWWSHTTRVGVSGFWNCIDFAGACYYTVTDCKIIDPANYGVYMHDDANADYGEVMFHGNTITLWKTTRNPVAAVHWESGGGIKFVNNKINGALQPAPGNASAGRFGTGFEILVKDGMTTVDCLIESNSIENCRLFGVNVGQLGPSYTGHFMNTVITGNEFGYNFGSALAISVGGHAANGFISDVVISDNVFANAGTQSITAQYVNGLTIGPNRHTNCTYAVVLNAGCYDVSMYTQNVSGDGKFLVFDATALESANSATLNNVAQRIEHIYTREIPATTSSSTYTTLFKFQVPTFAGGVMELVIAGGVAGKGSAVLRTLQAYNREAGNVVMTPIGSDTVTGTAFDYLLDVATSAGEVAVKVRLNAAAGGTNIAGRVRLRLEGMVLQVKKGA